LEVTGRSLIVRRGGSESAVVTLNKMSSVRPFACTDANWPGIILLKNVQCTGELSGQTSVRIRVSGGKNDVDLTPWEYLSYWLLQLEALVEGNTLPQPSLVGRVMFKRGQWGWQHKWLPWRHQTVILRQANLQWYTYDWSSEPSDLLPIENFQCSFTPAVPGYDVITTNKCVFLFKKAKKGVLSDPQFLMWNNRARSGNTRLGSTTVNPLMQAVSAARYARTPQGIREAELKHQREAAETARGIAERKAKEKQDQADREAVCRYVGLTPGILSNPSKFDDPTIKEALEYVEKEGRA
jgi:hypothetical protein